MGSLILTVSSSSSFPVLLILLSGALLGHSGPLSTEFIRPSFTASHFQFIDQSGSFLASSGGDFQAAITNSQPENRTFYFVVLHTASRTIIWSANRNSPISDSAKIRLTVNGLSITDDAGNPVWSTTPFSSQVALLQLQVSGNLVLLNQSNGSLWESFDHPTDTIVIGQRLPVGESLVGAAVSSGEDLSDYRFTVTGGDAIMQWNGFTYWKLSMYNKAYIDSNLPASYMAMNSSGLYLFGGANANANGSIVVIQVDFGVSFGGFRIAKLEHDGRFVVRSFSSQNWVQEFSGPIDDCRIPFFCGKVGLCSTGICSCPPGFHSNPQMNGDCTPTDSSYSLSSSSSCNAYRNGTNGNNSELNSSIVYMKLGNGMDYFANDFTEPALRGVSLSVCEGLCSRNCSCLGIFHGNSSGSCYFLQNHLGSIMASSTSVTDRMGYIKALVVVSSPANPNGENDTKRNFPLLGLVLLPSSGIFLLITVVIVIFWYRRKRQSRNALVKSGCRNYSSEEELEIISIPGLPVRFDYEELVVATENFRTQIGSGGFGTVYKGTLQDETVVAVKKITSSGVQGKKEFCTEIAIIGNMHHVNLVRLKGFCAQARQRFLVYEYMNRGSLDRMLFGNGNGPVLEWQERFQIALGTARGLAYLHSGCEPKIIHCDVKPENILLHDNLQVKISDFGLSKLLGPEQSSLFTTMRGTRGYLAPEWLTNSAISDKSDVYSYGMVLLEIVRGRKNCSPQTRQQMQSHGEENYSSNMSSSSGSGLESVQPIYFPLFALEMHEQRRYLELADPRLEGRGVTSEEMEKLVRVALCCVHEDPMLRPNMSNVVGMLEGGAPLGEPRLESLNFLRFFGRRFTEASTIELAEGYNEQNHHEFAAAAAAAGLFPRTIANATFHSNFSGGSHSSCSYKSSQQVSGPR